MSTNPNTYVIRLMDTYIYKHALKIDVGHYFCVCFYTSGHRHKVILLYL